MSRPPPPDPLPAFGTTRVRAGTTLHRVHMRSPHHGPLDFNPCKGGPTRFAPLHIPDAASSAGLRCIPTLYLGQTFEAALFESVFRDLPPLPGLRRVFESRSVAGASYATVAAARSLKLAALFEPNLHLLGLTRDMLIGSHGKDAYAWTVRWAAAIHRDVRDVDGLAWTSRQNDAAKAFILFGDRATGALTMKTDKPLDSGAGHRRLAVVAAKYQIELVPPRP